MAQTLLIAQKLTGEGKGGRTVKQILKFQCEVCGTKWGCAEAAIFCEAQTLPPCQVKAGDKIEAYERYDKPKADEVVSVRVGPSYFVGALKSRATSPEEWAQFISEGYNTPTHTWIIKMTSHHQYSKDGDAYSDEYEWSSVRLPKATHWLDGSECPSSTIGTGEEKCDK